MSQRPGPGIVCASKKGSCQWRLASAQLFRCWHMWPPIRLRSTGAKADHIFNSNLSLCTRCLVEQNCLLPIVARPKLSDSTPAVKVKYWQGCKYSLLQEVIRFDGETPQGRGGALLLVSPFTLQSSSSPFYIAILWISRSWDHWLLM